MPTRETREVNYERRRPHKPDRTLLASIEPSSARFYAGVGMLVSTVAGIEDLLFHAFRLSKRLPVDEAAAEYSKGRLFERRLRANDAVVQLGEEIAGAWASVWQGAESVLGFEAPRNLVAHNPIVGEDENLNALFDSKIFDSHIFDTGEEVAFSVSESDVEVLSGRRPITTLDETSIGDALDHASNVFDELEGFLERLSA